MDIQISREINKKIEPLIFEGKKIEAIKEIRKITKWGLKESKEYVDNLTLELYEKNRERFKYDPTKSKGCGTAVLLFIFLTTAAFHIFF